MNQTARIGTIVLLTAILLATCLIYFRRGKTRADGPSAKGNVNLAFALLSNAALPKADDVVRAFSAFATSKEQRLRLVGPQIKDVLQFETDSCGTALVALMPFPVPKGEADDAVQYSVSAMGTGWKLPAHAAHLIVTLKDMEGASSATARLSCFTSLLAAIAEASGAVAVYWGAAHATHDSKFFVSVAREPEAAARMVLWTGVSVAHEPDGRLSLLSLGMGQLNLPDLLLIAPNSSSEKALPTLFDLLGYLAERGKALPEGDTVGRTEGERLRVHYVPSPIDPNKKVWRVELE